jgi:hypothetical protein
MKIQYSALVGSTSGKLNGSVGSHNRGGAYLRNKGIVSNPSTPRQSSSRAVLGAVSSSWRQLTDEQRATWQAATTFFPFQDRLQQTLIPSGFQLFTGLNINLFGVSGDQLTIAPAAVTMPGLSSNTFTLTVDTSGAAPVVVTDLEVNFINEASGIEFAVQAEYTTGISPGVSNPGSRYLRAMGFAPIPSGTTGVLDVSEVFAYEDTFGVPTVGARVFVRTRVVASNTGQVSPWVINSAIVGSTEPVPEPENAVAELSRSRKKVADTE